jgi:hypothetical protein
VRQDLGLTAVNSLSPPRRGPMRGRGALLLALLVVLAGCGSGVAADTRARAAQAESCPETVMSTLVSVLGRVYREGISSERTASAEHMIEGSAALRQAIETNDPQAAAAAVQALIATGHMTNVQVTSASGHRLADVGGEALAPIKGTIRGASGRPIATYFASVWSVHGFVSEGTGVAEGLIALRRGDHSVAGSLALPAGTLPPRGTITRHGIVYQYDSLPAAAYPAGVPVQIYLLKTVPATEALCGATPEDTQVNTLERIANLIYQGERGPRTLAQVHRVQRDQALLEAVAARNTAGVKAASEALLHHHLVRLRVSAGGKLLYDLGGPYVLAPVHADLRLHGRTIGQIVISIQDDEGYLRLTRRLVGLSVLMYMRGTGGHMQLVKNSLGPGVGGLESVPAEGPYTYKGRRYRVFTVNAEAFPSGPLTIRVLMPVPYA